MNIVPASNVSPKLFFQELSEMYFFFISFLLLESYEVTSSSSDSILHLHKNFANGVCLGNEKFQGLRHSKKGISDNMRHYFKESSILHLEIFNVYFGKEKAYIAYL